MANFEQLVQTFGATIYGSEMKSSLIGCFNELSSSAMDAIKKLQDAEAKIKKLEDERSEQNG